MIAPIIYTLGGHDSYRVTTCEVARSGKWIDIDAYRPRIHSIMWGAQTDALIAEARELNEAQEALDKRHRAFRSKLAATQSAVLAAAMAEPRAPKRKAKPVQSIDPNLI